MENFENLSLALIQEIKQLGYFTELIQLVDKDLSGKKGSSKINQVASENAFLEVLQNEINQLDEFSPKLKQLCYQVDLPEHIYHSYTRHPKEEFNFFIYHLLKLWHLKLVFRVNNN